jgi:hypothetical protein
VVHAVRGMPSPDAVTEIDPEEPAPAPPAPSGADRLAAANAARAARKNASEAKP